MNYDETMIEDITAELPHLDATALRSIREMIDQLKRNEAIASPKNGGPASHPAADIMAKTKPLAFVGENLTLEEFERLSMKERARLQRRLREQNQQWLQENFFATGAAWLAIVDGKIIASGKTWKSKPLPPQTLEISQRTGKFPFIFANDKFMTIEESASAWNKTVLAEDYYPTLPIKLGSNVVAIEVIGELDCVLRV